MGWRKRVGWTLATVVVIGGGYVAADAYDVVPGPLTVEPPHPTASPFPAAPGAVPAPQPTDPLADLDPNAVEPSPGVLQAKVDALVRSEGLGTNVSAVVSDIDTQKVLASANPDAQIAPASTQKLLTAAAALTRPGPDAVLTTKAVQVSDGTVALVGGGDMMLAAGAGNPSAVNGHAGLGDLAKATATHLKANGVKGISLQLDDTLFTGPAVSPYWDPGDVAAGFAAPVSALAVDIGKLSDDEYAKREADPALAAATTFAKALQGNGIEVATTIARAKAPADAKVLAQVDSAPLSDIVDYFLQHSDNTITEVVGRIVAVDHGVPGSFDGATRAVGSVVESLGVDLKGAVLKDCSGLGRGSTLSARQLDQVVLLLTNPGKPALRSAAVGLPIAGLRGTLDTRYLDSAGRGLIRAKTGSLPGVVGLSGYLVTVDGRTLAFTLMTDNIPTGGSARVRQVFDSFASSLAQCGCRT